MCNFAAMKKILLCAAVAMTAVACSPYGKLLKSEDAEAQYRAALGYMETEKYQKALTLFDKVAIPYMNRPQADTIMFNIGMALYLQKNYEMSGDQFDRFRTTHQRSPMLEQAEYLYAMGHYFASPEPNRDQTATVKAIEAITTYIGRYPDTDHRADMEAKRDELNAKLREKAFINAYTYYKTGYHKPAVIALRNALKEYPDTEHREEILYLIARSSYEYAANSVATERRDRYLDMMDTYLNYISEYPEGAHTKELEKLYENARRYVAGHGGEETDPAETK
jgi:outer membrane protein assembly factor BamD